jgi:hypothetical protein
MDIESRDQSIDQTTASAEKELLDEASAPASTETAEEDDSDATSTGDDIGDEDSTDASGETVSEDVPRSDPAPQTAQLSEDALTALEKSQCDETPDESATDASISGMAFSCTLKNNWRCIFAFARGSAVLHAKSYPQTLRLQKLVQTLSSATRLQIYL